MRKKSRLTLEADESELNLTDLLVLKKETCLNPWNGKCGNTDIALYIMYRGRRLPICRDCWEAISSKDIEWTYD